MALSAPPLKRKKKGRRLLSAVRDELTRITERLDAIETETKKQGSTQRGLLSDLFGDDEEE